MLAADRQSPKPLFNAKEMAALERMSMHSTKHLRIGGDRDRLAALEDKYIFSIDEMRELGLRIGYRGVSFLNMGRPVGAPPVRGFKMYVRGNHWATRRLAFEGRPIRLDIRLLRAHSQRHDGQPALDAVRLLRVRAVTWR